MNNLLSILTREGVLLKTSVRYWRGCKQLKPEDIGLRPGDVSERLVSLGHKRLLPREALGKSSTGAMRQPSRAARNATRRGASRGATTRAIQSRWSRA